MEVPTYPLHPRIDRDFTQKPRHFQGAGGCLWAASRHQRVYQSMKSSWLRRRTHGSYSETECMVGTGFLDSSSAWVGLWQTRSATRYVKWFVWITFLRKTLGKNHGNKHIFLMPNFKIAPPTTHTSIHTHTHTHTSFEGLRDDTFPETTERIHLLSFPLEKLFTFQSVWSIHRWEGIGYSSSPGRNLGKQRPRAVVQRR